MIKVNLIKNSKTIYLKKKKIKNIIDLKNSLYKLHNKIKIC